MGLGVGILGFAHGHVNAYCARWRQNPESGVDVVAGWDHDRERLAGAVTSLGINACTSPTELLARRDVEAVVISAETSRHAELVEVAAAAGKRIALQKPMALTMDEADRIVAAVAAASVPFTVAWQMRVDPQNVKMKELLDSGELGKVLMVRRRHGLSTHLWPWLADSWHVDPVANRDIWADDAAHGIDFIHWLLGPPETVTAEIDSLLDPKIPMDNGVAIFRYPGGPIAEVCSSFTCAAGENTTEIVAEKGVIIQNYGDAPSCGVPRPDGACGLKWYLTETQSWVYSDIETPDSHGSRIGGLAEPLAEFFQGKRSPLATAEDGRMSLRMVLACYVSTREGRRVRIDEEGVRDV